MAVAPDLLEILRCPYCVSGTTRKPGDDPGRLELAHGNWLICQEPDCGRKYPIKEDIPVMLIEEGDKWVNIAAENLPAPGKLVEPEYTANQFGLSNDLSFAQAGPNRRLLIAIAGLICLLLIIGGLILLRRQSNRS